MDADNSGSITVDELKAGMKKAGSPVALAELQALLAHIDVDANGTPLPRLVASVQPMPSCHYFSFICWSVLLHHVLLQVLLQCK